ncbi:hypothetical protein BGZ65_005041 [Modicella reniformis]|uniref:Uncharacterized protein n=1 Tax=Modicella reniformis TaxID=1440133 RepID=A0A9P6IXU4_9FUNG|nr:hypothetical protein BGZ65_005041 [Modicella reniformis]
MDLQITVGNESALIGLLHVYKSYFPDLILAPLAISQQTTFKCPDQAMSALIMALQERWSHLGEAQAQQLTFNGSKEPLVRIGAPQLRRYHEGFERTNRPAEYTLTPLAPSVELFINFLKPLYGLFYLMGPVWKGELILCYTGLLQHWAQFKWKDYLEIGKSPRLSEQGQEGLRRLFTKLGSDVDYMQTVRVFIDHVDSISSVALEVERDHIAVQHGVLSFFDLVSSLIGTYEMPLAVVIPDSTIVYRCFLSDSGMSVSRICGIVYQYKKAFHVFEQEQQLQYDILVQTQLSRSDAGDDQAAELPVALEIPGYGHEYVALFNSFVMDICNFLWRSRAFNKSDKNARGFLMDQGTIGHIRQVCMDGGLSMNNMLSIMHSTALSGYSARFLRSLEEEENVPMEKRLKAPVSVPALKDVVAKGGLNMTFEEYRIRYLDYLEQHGFDGVYQFLIDSITNLLQRKLQNQEQQREQQERRLSLSMQQISIGRDNHEDDKDAPQKDNERF